MRSPAASHRFVCSPSRRRWAWLLFIVLAATVAWHRAGLQGLIFPVRVTSGSMAETLLGPHWSVTCDACHFVFPCGTEYPPANGHATCPNCGFGQNPIDPQNVCPGDRVLIDRWSYHFRRPARGDLVALQRPGDRAELVVKRVVGLPDEQVEIHDGDVWINEKPLRKSWQTLREVATTIHADDCRSTHETNESVRWRPAESNSGWQREAEGYRFAGRADAGAPESADKARDWDWLVYHHRTCLPPPRIEDGDAPWLDYDPYNHSLSRALHPIRDLLVTMHVRNLDRQPMAIMLNTTGHMVMVHWNPETSVWEAVENGATCARVPFTWDPGRSAFHLQIACYDGHVVLGIDESVVLEHLLADTPRSTSERADQRADPAAPAVRIGARRGNLAIRDLRLARDLYYLPAAQARRGSAVWNTRTGGRDAYVLLGDNSPISEDSREWGSVPAAWIVGRVMRWDRSPK